MRHSDTFSAALFNVALHGEVQNIQIQGTVGNGLVQLFGCADDIAVMSYGAGSTEGTIISIGEERNDTWFIST
jgi:hypothetical protein